MRDYMKIVESSMYDAMYDTGHVSSGEVEMTGRLQHDDTGLHIWVDEFPACGYDVTLKGRFDPHMLVSLIGKTVVATVERRQRAGMIAPHLGHVIVTDIRPAE